MSRFIPAVDEKVLEKTAARCRERGVVIPTIAEQKDPSRIPEVIKKRLAQVGMWDVDPVNLFRISWKNEPKEKGGLFGQGNWVEFPSSLTGVPARIVGLVGKYFPTGAHKVGAGYACLVPRLMTGAFDPTTQRAVWPSTGNFCRGGAFDCALLACDAIAILPEGMSKERFDWLKQIGTREVFATPGTESNVKEIYDKCWELRKERGRDIVIFNQFEEFGNYAWHYHVTGGALHDVFNAIKKPSDRLSLYISATGSAGTIAAGDFLKTQHSGAKIVATEALQCPTLYQNGFGAHRIEGIGDKHVPWIHNVRNTDMVAAIDDEQCMSLFRLFNEPAGHEALKQAGVDAALVEQLPLCGISSIANLVAGIKAAKYFELTANDVIMMPLTDSAGMYGSRLAELSHERGAYTPARAARDHERYLPGTSIDYLKELDYPGRKALHNLKYFTWVEQQGKTSDELNALWDPSFWVEAQSQVSEWDARIKVFNARTGVLKGMQG